MNQVSNPTTIKLYGSLADICGREVKLYVNSTAEAVKALICNFPELKTELSKDNAKYNILVGRDNIAEEELQFPTSSKQVIRIVPVVAGAGGDLFKIVIGVALVAATGGFAGISGGAIGGFGLFTGGGLGGLVGGVLGKIGMSLILGGIASLFFRQPKQDKPSESPENDPSFYFRGVVNTTAQGQPVSIGYGELRIGSAVIGAGLTTVDT